MLLLGAKVRKYSPMYGDGTQNKCCDGCVAETLINNMN